MEKQYEKTVVNSWNEWDPLKHIIIGRATNTCIAYPEPGWTSKLSVDSELRKMHGPRSLESVQKADELLDNYAKILEGRGIRVDRPTPLQWNQSIATPDWRINYMVGCMPPRDVILTVGNEMLEATQSYRCRWFEYLAYRDLLQKYFEEDPNMKWEAAPKPRLTDKSYHLDFVDDSVTEEQRRKWSAERHFVTTEEEPLFDAADVCRLGKDLFVQNGLTVNLKGIEWLKRHFPDHRVHTVNFPDDPYPTHIDATLVPLRPGLVLNHPEKLLPAEQKKIFDINGWEILEAAPPAHENKPPLCASSVWISMNFLLLDPKTVCVEATEVHQMEQLDKLGFEVVPVPFRDVQPMGGGLHCATTDVYRESTCEDYFPKQIEGF